MKHFIRIISIALSAAVVTGACGSVRNTLAEADQQQDSFEDQQQMLGLMDAINLTIYENNTAYQPEEDVFIWNCISNAMKYYALKEAESSETEMVEIDSSNQLIRVSQNLITEYMEAMFPGQDLPYLPESADAVEDSEEGFYDIGLPDERSTYTKITSWEENEDGSVTVITNLKKKENDTLLLQSEYILQKNEAYEKDPETEYFAYEIQSASVLN